jgi:hypothetical protein
LIAFLSELPPASSAGLSREVMRNSVCSLISVPFQSALGGPIGRLGDSGHLLVVRHLAGDEDVVARDQRGDEAGMLRHRHAVGLRRPGRALAAGQNRDHGDVHVGARDQQLVHQHRRAGRHEFLEHRLAGTLIRIHHLRVRVVLIDTHDVAKVAALGGDQPGKAIDDEVAFAAVARRAAERKPGLAGDCGGETVLEVACHVAGEEQPRAGAHALRVCDLGAPNARRSDAFHVGHYCLPPCPADCCRCFARHAARVPPRRRVVRARVHADKSSSD